MTPFGHPWFMNLPIGWTVQPFKRMGHIRNGQVDPRDPEYRNLPLYAPNHIESATGNLLNVETAAEQGAESGKYPVRRGEIVYSKIRPALRKVMVAPAAGLCSADMYAVTPCRGVESRFLFWALLSEGFSAAAELASDRVAMPKVNRETLADFPLPRPPSATQGVIADFLDCKTAGIDALIEKKQKLLDLLAEKRAALINQAVTKGLDPKVPMKDSGIPALGVVPAHWEVVRNKVLVREIVDLSQTGKEEMLTVSHITGVTKRSEKDVTMFMAASNVGYKRVRPGDLVINTMWAWMAALGTATERGIVSPAYGVYRFDHDRMDPGFYDLFYRTPQYVVEMTRYSKGVWSSRLRLYPESFLRLLVVVPPIDEQHQILDTVAREVGSLPATMKRLGESILRLQEYRQALITAAVTGQIDVSMERSVES